MMSDEIIQLKIPSRYRAFFFSPGILGLLLFLMMTPIAMLGLLSDIETARVQLFYLFLGIFLGTCSTILIDIWGWFIFPRVYYKYFLSIGQQWLIKASWSALLLAITVWLYFQHQNPRSILLVSTMLFTQFFTTFFGMIVSVTLTFKQRRIKEPKIRRKIWILIEQKEEKNLKKIATILNCSLEQVRFLTWELITAGQLKGYLSSNDKFIDFGSTLNLYQEYLRKLSEWPLKRVILLFNQKKKVALIELARIFSMKKEILKEIITDPESDVSLELQGEYVILKENTDSDTLQEQLRRILQQKIDKEKSKS